jgi:hypothetical protein
MAPRLRDAGLGVILAGDRMESFSTVTPHTSYRDLRRGDVLELIRR